MQRGVLVGSVLLLVTATGCRRIGEVLGTSSGNGESSASGAPTPGTEATTGITSSGGVASSSGGSSASGGTGPSTKATRILKVYVAGESIERRVRWVERPLLADGRLNERGAQRNDDDEYGWVVPFADRLALRFPGSAVAWVGTDAWLGHDDVPYDGKYPPTAGPTSAISGTSIESWLEQRRGELEKKKHCYDVAIAARGGNDFDVDDNKVLTGLSELVHLLSHGSSCRPSPLVLVTAHMPDDQRNGKGPDDKTYVAAQKARFVTRFRGAAESLRKEGMRVRFVDLYTPFVENKKTTAFPNEAWSRGGIPDYAKIGRDGDRMHPRRLASIYAGELAADAVDGADLAAP